MIALGIAAFLGRLTRRRKIIVHRQVRWPAMMGWLIACAGVVTGLRVLAHIRRSVVVAALAPIAFATLLAIVAGFAWQRQPSRFGGGPRALAAALTCVGFVLGLGYWRHHVPWEPGIVRFVGWDRRW